MQSYSFGSLAMFALGRRAAVRTLSPTFQLTALFGCELNALPAAPSCNSQKQVSAALVPSVSWTLLPQATRTFPGAAHLFASGAAEQVRLADHKQVLYRGPYLLGFRLLVRFKLAQLGCVATLCIPFHSLLVQGSVDGMQLAITSVLFAGCAVVSTTLFYFSRRFIGELAIVGPASTRTLCISTLDFWGDRQDNFVRLEDVVPLLNVTPPQAAQLARQAFVPFKVESQGDRQYLLSLRHGKLVDRHTLFQLLEGVHRRPAE